MWCPKHSLQDAWLRLVQKVASAIGTSVSKHMQHSHISSDSGVTFGGGGGKIAVTAITGTGAGAVAGGNDTDDEIDATTRGVTPVQCPDKGALETTQSEPCNLAAHLATHCLHSKYT